MSKKQFLITSLVVLPHVLVSTAAGARVQRGSDAQGGVTERCHHVATDREGAGHEMTSADEERSFMKGVEEKILRYRLDENMRADFLESMPALAWGPLDVFFILVPFPEDCGISARPPVDHPPRYSHGGKGSDGVGGPPDGRAGAAPFCRAVKPNTYP